VTADGSETMLSLDWTQRSLCDDPSWRVWSEPATPSRAEMRGAMPGTHPPAHPPSTPRSVAYADSSRAVARRMAGARQLALCFDTTNGKSTGQDGPTVPRPTTRAECCEEARPCPWVGCRHHLLVTEVDGRLRLNLPARTRRPTLGPKASEREVEIWIDEAVEALQRMTDTCSLDVAETVDGRLGKRRLGRLLGMSPSGARNEINHAEGMLRDAIREEP
jgi:hypothetical protein